MEVGKIVEIEGVIYISERDISGCEGCAFDNEEESCSQGKNINCLKDKNIMIRVSHTLIEQVEYLRDKIEQLEKQIEMMKSCHTCIYSDKTNFYNYKFKCNTCAGKCNWSNDFDSLEFLEAEDYRK